LGAEQLSQIPALAGTCNAPVHLARGIGQLEARVDVDGAPLAVGDRTAIQVDDLLLGEGLLIVDVLDVDLHDLEGLGAVPVDEFALLAPASRPGT
jgi:hypothetical protein